MAYPNPSSPRSFWRDALDWRHSITRHLLGRILAFTSFALLVSLAFRALPWSPFEISHIQYTGSVLGLLLVLRTNAGYERWWEGRKLWGGIVNQSRNLVSKALAYGPRDPVYREQLVRWSAAFCHTARRSLRGQRVAPELGPLLGAEGHAAVSNAVVVVTSAWWLAPLITTLVAYPLLAVDQIGQELENPFAESRLSHLPLDTICETIEGNLMALLNEAAEQATKPDGANSLQEEAPRLSGS